MVKFEELVAASSNAAHVQTHMRHIGIGPARTLAEDGNFDASLVCYPSEDIAFRRGLRTWATGKMEGRIQPLSHGGSGTLFKI